MGPATILKTEKVSNEQLRAIMDMGSIIGDFDKIRWLYESLQTNILTLLRSYRLEEDGMVDITHDNTENYYLLVRADAYFHSIVASAKRFIDSSEAMIKKYFGKDSEQYKTWRNTVTFSYNNSEIYCLMYELRNRLEHDFWIISLVDIDMKKLKAGLAINIDNDLFNSNFLKRHTKDRLRKWASERICNGEPAWLSLGESIETYQGMTLVLYEIIISFLYEKASSCAAQHCQTLQNVPGNLVLWKGRGTEKHSASNQYRAYDVSGEAQLEQIRCELNHIETHVGRLLE